jgi:hypothetical protein
MPKKGRNLMAINRRKCLMILVASIILLALPGCSGESTSATEGQDISEVPTETQAHPTATRTQVPPTAEPTEPPAPDWGDSVTWLASDPYAASGLELQLQLGYESDTEAIMAGDPQEPAYRTGGGEILPSDDGNEMGDHFIQFNIDDSFLHGGIPTQSVQIEVEYLDEGTDMFFIEYDGENDQGPFGDGRFAGTRVVTKTDSGEVRTASFWVDDGYFANRDNDGDFRISDAFDGGGEIIRRVTVTRIVPGSELASALLVNFYDDGDHLALGQCTTLHWAVENATHVTLNDNPVDPQGYEYMCPEITTSYALLAWNASEQVQEEITIVVSADQPPPPYDLAAVCIVQDYDGVLFDSYWVQCLSSPPITSPKTIHVEYWRGTPGDMYLWYGTDKQFEQCGRISGPSAILPEGDSCCRTVITDANDSNPANDSYTYCY